MKFAHQDLKAYQRSLDFKLLADELTEKLPKGRGYIADQLRRAALSIPLNVAEGYSEFSHAEKARFYRISRRSATEAAACLDVCRRLNLVPVELIEEGEEILISVLKLITGLIRSQAMQRG